MPRIAIVAVLLASAAAQAPPQSHARQVVCACVAPSCHFGKPVAGGWIYEPEKIEGESPDPACLPRGTRSGVVILSVRIDEDGRVTDACVLRGLTDLVDRQAVASVLTWRYEPAALARPQNGSPVGTPVPIAISVAVDIRPNPGGS